MRLIDADILIKDLKAMSEQYDAIALDGMIRGIERQETIDAVLVVRCKDCAESAILGDPAENRRYCAHLGFRVEDEGFCCDGRRAGDPEPDDC